MPLADEPGHFLTGKKHAAKNGLHPGPSKSNGGRPPADIKTKKDLLGAQLIPPLSCALESIIGNNLIYPFSTAIRRCLIGIAKGCQSQNPDIFRDIKDGFNLLLLKRANPACA